MSGTNLLANIRKRLLSKGLSGWICTSGDPHISEYTCAAHKHREFLTGFTGSAGTAVVSLDEALLWTDGRYWLQATSQLSSEWKLMKDGIDSPIEDKLKVLGPVGFNPLLVSEANRRKWIDSGKVQLVADSDDVVESEWHNRPALPAAKVIKHELEFCGRSTTEKLSEIRTLMLEQKADMLIVGALDEIAWLLNIRGADVEFNPIVLSYLIITEDKAHWYVDASKLDDDVSSWVQKQGIKVFPYEAVFKNVRDIATQKQFCWADPAKTNALLFSTISSLPNIKVIDKNSPVSIPKAIKNKVEIENLKKCSIRDSAALVRFFSWLESVIARGTDEKGKELTEYSVAKILHNERKKEKNFIGESFATISSSGPNAAIIHYKPEKESSRRLNIKEIYLCDSGGQYLDGTTDVTRTFHFGNPSDEEKNAFTRVLQGHINLSSTVFPAGTTGHKLDPLARVFLWQDQKDYAHGTGHGVGFFLNVHEGPTLISFRDSTVGMYFSCPLSPNMTCTIEPGYYEDGKFGCRVENDTFIRTIPQNHTKQFLGFQNLTFVPLGKNLIQKSLLTQNQINWINQYHSECHEKVLPLVQGDALAAKWLEKECSPL